MIPNKFVDWMISKNFRIGGGFDNVLTLLANHNYLAYFPSYFTTKIVIIKVSKDQEKYGKLLDIFIASPLIKFNREIVDILL